MPSISDAASGVPGRSGLVKRAFLTATSVTAMLTAGAVAGFNPAHAQSTSQTAAQAPVVEEIVITGSLIVRNGYQAPTPVTVMNVEDIERDGSINFSDFATKLPALAGNYNSHNGAISSSDGNAGTNSLSLRDLGANRTLVLLDGVRVTGNSATGIYSNGGAVDINAFPDAMISRMDIVTGGATATYGAGALSGVVNVILDTGFTGLKGSASGGVTTYGDDRQYALSMTAGTNFASNRGHFVISAEDHYTAGVPNAQQARPWMAHDVYQITNPAYTATNGQPFYLIVPDAGSAMYAPGGVITSGPLKGITFGPGGVPRQFIYGSPTDGNAMQGGEFQGGSGSLNSNYSTDGSLDIPLSRQNLYTRVSYELTDNIEVYFTYDWAYSTTSANARGNRTPLTIRSGNPFIPAQIQAQMTALNLATIALGKYPLDLGYVGSNGARHFNMFLGGAKGKFEAADTTWSWNVFATRSIARTSATGHNVYITANMTAAADAVAGPNGTIICRSTLTSPTNGCVPYNPFGTTSNSQAAIDYLFGPYGVDRLNQRIWLDQVAGSVHGEPFSTWAGPVGIALGAEYNKNAGSGIVDPRSAASGYSTANFNATNGSFHANEGYAEVAIPLAKDTVWARSFDLNGGVRATDFSNSGTIMTWKVGATYSPIDDIRFRVTRSHDTRAPNMGELFSLGQFVNANLLNPFLGNKTVPVVSLTTGNATLAPEEANTTGLGVVIQPSFFPGFSTSFDYYKIAIGPSITTAGSQLTINDCFAGIQAFCANIIRDSANNISTVYGRPVNAASAVSEGFDVEASYKVQLADINNDWSGSLTLRALASHILTMTSTSADGTTVPATNPQWRYNLSAVYDSDLLSVGWSGRGRNASPISAQWIQCSSGCPTSVPPAYTSNNNLIPGQFYMDLSFTYHLQSESFKSDLFFNIENLTNGHPDPIAFLGPQADIGSSLGRSFRAGVRFKM